MPRIVTSIRSSTPYSMPSAPILRSPTALPYGNTRDFGSILESREFSAQSLSIGELLRTL